MDDQIQNQVELAVNGFDASVPPQLIDSVKLASCCRSAKW